MSDNAEYLKCACDYCGQELEFPADGLGTEIECPTCHHRTMLHRESGQTTKLTPTTVPAPKSPTPTHVPLPTQPGQGATKQTEPKKANFAWSDSLPVKTWQALGSVAQLKIGAALVIAITLMYALFKPKEMTLSGQVFIVTKGAENVKLGGVEILLFENGKLTKFLRARETVMAAEEGRRCSEVQQEVLRVTGIPYFLTNASGGWTSNPEAIRKMTPTGPFNSEKNAEKDAVISKVNSLTDWLKSFPAPRDYFSGVSSTVAVIRRTVTDADGRFSIICPGGRGFALYATAERTIPGPYGGDTETYYWLIAAPHDAENAQVLLNNSTLATIHPHQFFKLKPNEVH